MGKVLSVTQVSPNAYLQGRILAALRAQDASSISALARQIDASRASVSRAVTVLSNAQLVAKSGRELTITPAGKVEEARFLRERQTAHRKLETKILARTKPYQNLSSLIWPQRIAGEAFRAGTQGPTWEPPADFVKAAETVTAAMNVPGIQAAIDALNLPMVQEVQRRFREQQAVISRVVEGIGALPNMSTQYFLPPLDMGNLRINWEKILDAGTRGALEVAGLMPSSHMSKAFRHEVLNAYVDREGENREPEQVSAEIESVALRHYDANNCQLVANIVERLKAAPEFDSAKQILDDVLTSHRAGAETITMLPLLLLIEPVAFPFVASFIDLVPNDQAWQELIDQIFAQKVAWAENPWTEKRKKGEREHLRSLRTSLKDLSHADVAAALAIIHNDTRWTPKMEGAAEMVDMLGRFIYRNSQPGDPLPVDPITKLPRLNRHQAAHGITLTGTRIDTLRCFLVLDLLAELIAQFHQDLAA